MRGRDLLSIADLSAEEIWRLLRRARTMKAGALSPLLAGRSVALLFQKPSLRTRVSFEVALHQLGAHAVYLGQQQVGINEREPIQDIARVLSRYVDAIVARIYPHRNLELLAHFASVPVINALTDREHPCQALADLLTIWEHRGELKGTRLAYVGDGNNVAHSLLLASALVGMHFSLAAPQGYQPAPDIVALARPYALQSGACLRLGSDPVEAVAGAEVVYTDVWTSMGQEAEHAERLRAFQGYQVNEALLSYARPDAIVMHDLPAHRGEEITEEAMASPRSVIFDQAGNRLAINRAILVAILDMGPGDHAEE